MTFLLLTAVYVLILLPFQSLFCYLLAPFVEPWEFFSSHQPYISLVLWRAYVAIFLGITFNCFMVFFVHAKHVFSLFSFFFKFYQNLWLYGRYRDNAPYCNKHALICCWYILSLLCEGFRIAVRVSFYLLNLESWIFFYRRGQIFEKKWKNSSQIRELAKTLISVLLRNCWWLLLKFISSGETDTISYTEPVWRLS